MDVAAIDPILPPAMGRTLDGRIRNVRLRKLSLPFIAFLTAHVFPGAEPAMIICAAILPVVVMIADQMCMNAIAI